MHEDTSDLYRSASGLQLWSIYRSIYMQVWRLICLQLKKITTIFIPIVATLLWSLRNNNLCGISPKHSNIFKKGGGWIITICVVLLDINGGNVVRYSSSQNSHFEKVKVDFIDQLVANFRSTCSHPRRFFITFPSPFLINKDNKAN